jgi:L-threonylcarbamoyladenylate synthase
VAPAPKPVAAIEAAIERLAAGGFIAYPTETVWGLGACADNDIAVDRLLCWKGRSGDAPMSLLVDAADAAAELGCEVTPLVKKLMDAFWPGPLTIVLPCRSSFAKGVARSDGALGLRCSPHPIARTIASAAREAGLSPLTSTSLNRTGASPARDMDEAIAMTMAESDGNLQSPLAIDAAGNDAGRSAPSSVVDCTRVIPEILRDGAIERQILQKFWID